MKFNKCALNAEFVVGMIGFTRS